MSWCQPSEHGKLKLHFIPLLLAVVYTSACSSGGPHRSTDAAPLGIEAQVAKSIAEQEKIENAGFENRFAALQKVIAAPSFKSLPGDTQYRDLLTAGKLAMVLEQPRRGYDYIASAAVMPQADYYDRLLQVQTAMTLGLNADAVSGMTVIVRRWPEHIADLPNGLLDRIFRQSGVVPHSERLSLLRALYAMHWKLKWDIEPSGAWQDLVLLLLERGMLPEAIDVSTHVTDLYELIGMRADRRFDAIVAAHPDHFDIRAAGERQLHDLESASENAPHVLELRSDVILALVHQQHYAAMLAETDAVLTAVQSTNFRDKLYVDYYEQFGQFLNLRSIALERAGRWDDAVSQLSSASVGNNTNQLINLAALYCKLGRPKDALEQIGRVRGDTSPYGAMQLEWVRLEAAVQMGDRRQVAPSLQYLKKHAADSPWAYMSGLLSLKQYSRAAKLLVAELLNLDERAGALMNVQDYAHQPQTPWEAEFASRWHEVIARKEVQAAIHKVGRVESYHLEAP